MKLTLKSLSLTFSAGCLGGLVNMITVWSFGVLGVTKSLGVSIAPQLTAPWLYNRLAWGGIWGLLFLLPLGRLAYPTRGLVFSLGPTLVQLGVVFPYQAHKGVLGLQLGHLTPVLVLFFNAVWGLVAGLWLSVVEKS